MKIIFSDKIKEFFTKYPEHLFNDGQIIIYSGDQPKYIFYLVSGQVRQYSITDQGKEIVINVFKAPSFFPINLLDAQVINPYFYEAISLSTIKIVPFEDVLKFFKDKANYAATFDLIRQLTLNINDLQQRLTYIMGESAKNRAFFELLQECNQSGKKQKNGDYIVSIHEDELAKRTGLSRETVNRELAVLKKLKIIAVTHSALIIKNIKKLKQKLNNKI